MIRTRCFAWEEPRALAERIRAWATSGQEVRDVDAIRADVAAGGDAAVLELTARYDATERAPRSLRVDPAEIAAALEQVEPALRESLKLAAANIRAVAGAHVREAPGLVELPQGQTVAIREVPVGAAGIYAPGGRAPYPSSLLMGCIPALAAGVGRVAVATPPGPDGHVNRVTLAAAATCGVSEVYAMGGAQAIFALADGTESVQPVDVIAGPGSRWVQEAKRAVFGKVGIDTLAGPSELMLVAAHDTDPSWAALDLCAQAEHGSDGLLVLAAVEEAVLDGIVAAVERMAVEWETVADAPLAVVQVDDLGDAIALANSLAPEHLQLMSEDAAALAEHVTTAGAVFVGPAAATAFGDYAAGSNHILPTGGAGRFSGALAPPTFRRRIANVSLPGPAAAALAPHVETLARAEGFPVHGESAMARRRDR
jgi:histidinol dehydrogenase